MGTSTSSETSNPAPRILLIRRRYLGDIVLLGSAVANLRLHWPGAHIAFLVDPLYHDVPPLIPDVNRTWILPAGAGAWPGFLLKIRRERFTHVFDFDNTEGTAALAAWTGARVRVTVALDSRKIRFRRNYTHLARIPLAEHDSQSIIDTYHRLLHAADIPTPSRQVRLVPGDAAQRQARRLVSGASRKVLIHPGTRSTFRLWPVDRFAALIDRMQEELDLQVFLAGGPSDPGTLRAIRQRTRTHVILLDKPFTVEEFAAIVAQFDLFVCHDSGPMHIASAVGTRVVALFGSQNATVWRPQGDNPICLQTDLPCTCFPPSELPKPCIPNDAYRSFCVRKIPVSAVFQAVASQLKCMLFI